MVKSKVVKKATGGIPVQSNKGGAMRGLDRAAAMRGVSRPTMPTQSQAPTSRPTMPAQAQVPAGIVPGRPAMKKGGVVKKAAGGFVHAADGVAKKGKTKGKFV